MNNQSTGKLGETLARHYLEENGYSIIDTHVTFQWGEIDIIAKREDIIAFVEVKTRFSLRQGKPYESITWSKRNHLRRSMQAYILQHHLLNSKLALDLVSIELQPGEIPPKITLYKNIPL